MFVNTMYATHAFEGNLEGFLSGVLSDQVCQFIRLDTLDFPSVLTGSCSDPYSPCFLSQILPDNREYFNSLLGKCPKDALMNENISKMVPTHDWSKISCSPHMIG